MGVSSPENCLTSFSVVSSVGQLQRTSVAVIVWSSIDSTPARWLGRGPGTVAMAASKASSYSCSRVSPDGWVGGERTQWWPSGHTAIYLSIPLKLCRKRMCVEVFCEVQEYVENCNSLTLREVLEVDRGLGWCWWNGLLSSGFYCAIEGRAEKLQATPVSPPWWFHLGFLALLFLIAECIWHPRVWLPRPCNKGLYPRLSFSICLP